MLFTCDFVFFAWDRKFNHIVKTLSYMDDGKCCEILRGDQNASISFILSSNHNERNFTFN